MNNIFKDKDFFYIDDLLTKKQMNYIEEKFLDRDTPYYFTDCINATVTENHSSKTLHIENVIDHQQMVHLIYFIDINTGNTNVNSSNHTIVDDLVNIIKKHFNLNKLNIARAKVNLQHQFTNNKPEYFNPPHTDLKEKHWVCIYYISDCDGDTLFFDSFENCNIIGRVSPKKGRLLFFDGKMIHAGQHPIKSTNRLLMNMDFYYD